MIALLQAAGGLPDNMRILLGGSTSTRLVLVVLALFSIASWVMIVWKWRQFRTMRRDGYRFVQAIERSQRLEDAFRETAEAFVGRPDNA